MSCKKFKEDWNIIRRCVDEIQKSEPAIKTDYLAEMDRLKKEALDPETEHSYIEQFRVLQTMNEEIKDSIDQMEKIIYSKSDSLQKTIRSESQTIQQTVSVGNEMLQRAIKELEDRTKALKESIAEQYAREMHGERIETTKATIGRCTEDLFVPTKVFEDAKSKLRRRKLVIIKGNLGDGKTRTANELMAWMWKGDDSASDRYNKQPVQLHYWDNTLKPNMNLCILIDNISSDLFNEIEKRQESVRSLISGELNGLSNCLILTVRNDIFRSLSSNNIFVEENIVDTSSKMYQIETEKRQILNLYLPKEVQFSEEMSEIVQCAPNIGFPQCCRLFRDIPELQKQGVKFIENPYDFMKIALSKFEYGRCAARLYLFFCDGQVLEEDLDPCSDKIDKTVVEEAFKVDLGEVTVVGQIEHEKKVQLIQKSLECLFTGSLVTKQELSGDGLSYQFSHDSVKHTIALLYNEVTQVGFMKNCPFSYLYDIILYKNIVNKFIKAPNNIYMYKCLLRALECQQDSYNYKRIASLDVWGDSQFVSGFLRWIDDEKINNFHLKWTTKVVLFDHEYNVRGDKHFPSFLVYVAYTNNLCLINELLDRTLKDHPQLQCALFGLVRAGHTDVLGKIVERCTTTTVKANSSHSSHYVGNVNVLHEACLWEREEMVEMLAKKYPFLVHETCDDKLSTLHVVVRTGNCSLYDLVEKFVFGDLDRDERVKRLSEMVDTNGMTILHYSCRHSCDSNTIVLHLLDKYPSLVQATGQCELPILHVAVETGNCSLYDKIETLVFGDLGRDELVKRLSRMIDDKGRTVLHYSCSLYCNKNKIVLHLLDKYPYLLQATRGCKLPILHVAVETGDCSLYDIIETFVFGDLGSDERVKRLSEMVDDKGRTVLHYSCGLYCCGNTIVLHLLDKYPSLVQATGLCELQMLYFGVDTGNWSLYDKIEALIFGDLGRDERVNRLSEMVDDKERTVLHYSCGLYCCGNTIVLHLLDKYPSLVQATGLCELQMLYFGVDTGNWSLYDKIEALIFGDLSRDERVKRLTEMVDDEGRTVLHYSCSLYCSENTIVFHLLDKYPYLVQATGGCKQPILHVAVETGDCSLYDIIETFVFGDLGSDERVKRLSEMLDDEGRTVLCYSCDRCLNTMAEYLLNKYPELASIRDKDGWHCLHNIARRSNKDLFTAVDSYLRKYYQEKRINYDITSIVTNTGESILSVAEEAMYNYLSQFWS